jgi:hypothetical protein
MKIFRMMVFSNIGAGTGPGTNRRDPHLGVCGYAALLAPRAATKLP